MAFHIAARPLAIIEATLPFCRGLGCGLDGGPRAAGADRGTAAGCSQSAAQRCARRSSAGPPHASLCPNSAICASASEITHWWSKRDGRDRDRAMAVSQPRPPDRVDAVLEKVAPLRYLEAHECARSERAVTRYYHKILPKPSFLRYKRRFLLKIEDYDVFPHKIERYVILLTYF